MSPLHVSINFELTGVGLIAVAVWALLFTRRQLAAMQRATASKPTAPAIKNFNCGRAYC